ncbi:MAG: translation elongation factor EF-1 subunit alpha, partial [Crenarchaeota archaeon]|nr:translation elongation factor EF-1 subunit alpha [Thermoproteota archaeon]
MSKSEKPHLNIIIMGHVDHGKSTTTGHLMVDVGAVDERTLKAYQVEAEQMGKGTFSYAWVLDNLKEERERGVTIDLRFLQFQTKKYNFTVIDAPGHRDFIKNMITGASQADACVLFCSAKKGEFEAGIGAGGQTREHAFLAFTLGIRQVVVAINKFDDSIVNYSKDRYEEIKAEVTRMLTMSGFKVQVKDADGKMVEKIRFVPVSGWTGENLVKRSENMPWYTGPTLIEALDLLEVPAKPTNKPLRMPVQDVYTITGIGTVPVGRVETGTIKPGETIVFMPSNKTAEVKSLEMHHTSIPVAEPGDNIGINVRGIAKNDVHRGDVAGPASNPPTVAKEFIGQIIVIYHPTAIAAGYTPVLHYHTGQIACRFTELLKKIDPRSGQVTEEHPSFLKTGDAAWVRMEPLHPIAVETFTDFPELGRFAVRDMGTTVAAGAIK